MQDVKEDGSGRVLFISPLKLSDHVWLLRKIWGNGGKLVEVASPKWGAFPSRVCFEKMFTPKTRYRWTNKNWGNMILIVAKASIHKLLLCFSQFAVCWKPATLFFRSFFFWGGQTPWTSLNTNSPWCDDTVNHPETLGWWTPSMSSQLHPVFSHDADASHPAGFPAAFLEISAPGISYQNLYLRLLFNGSRGGRYQTHNHFCKAEKAPFEFDIIEMIILKSNESTFLWPIF